jgi:hypothetical protein
MLKPKALIVEVPKVRVPKVSPVLIQRLTAKAKGPRLGKVPVPAKVGQALCVGSLKSALQKPSANS